MDRSFSDGSHEWKDLSHYRFVVHLWQKDGQRLSSSANCSAKFRRDNEFSLQLEHPVLEQITFEIEVSEKGQMVEENGSALLYSNCGKGRLGEAFGGGSFEEYSTMPWIQWF